MKIALLHVTNHIQTVEFISDSCHQTLSSVFGQFVHWWHQSEEERKRKEDEEASLFKYKRQTHGSDQKPEDEEEKELREIFPSYENVNRMKELNFDHLITYNLDSSNTSPERK